MKVKELISELSTFNPEAEVTFWTSPSDELVILSIYSGDLRRDSSIYNKGNPLTDPDVSFDMGSVYPFTPLEAQ